MRVCDPCFDPKRSESIKPAKTFLFRVIDSGSGAPGVLRDKEVDLCKDCESKAAAVLAKLPELIRSTAK